jgi:FkbM family methyltransferase
MPMNYNVDEYIKYELPHQKKLLQLFDQNASLVIFDIGACECLDSIRYSLLFPNSEVYAFEPLPKNIESGKAYIEQYNRTNITLTQVALSNQEGTAKFFVSSGRPQHEKSSEDWDFGNKSSSLLQPDKTLEAHDWLKFHEKIEVKTNTLASFCKLNFIESIDFIHMDVQGAELMVLQGATEYLKKVKSIWLEVEKISLYKDQPLKKDIELFMKVNNFVKIMDTVDRVAGDQFYVNKLYFNNEKPLTDWDILKRNMLKKIKKILFKH